MKKLKKPVVILMISDHLKNLFTNSNIILAQKQPKNLLRLLSKARFNTDTNNFIQLKGLFKCTDKRCKICLLYVNEGNSFVMSNNMRWELRSHVTCRDINVIYYLKCNMCKYNHETKRQSAIRVLCNHFHKKVMILLTAQSI